MLHTVPRQSHLHVHSPSFWSSPPNKTEYLVPRPDNHMKSCVRPAQGRIPDDVLEATHSLCLPHTYWRTAPELGKEGGAGRFTHLFISSLPLHCDLHAWTLLLPFTPFLSRTQCQVYKQTVTWSASRSWQREGARSFPSTRCGRKSLQTVWWQQIKRASRPNWKGGRCKRLGQPFNSRSGRSWWCFF